MASQITAHHIHSTGITMSDAAKCLPKALWATSCGEMKIKIAILEQQQRQRQVMEKIIKNQQQIHFPKETKAIPTKTKNDMVGPVSPFITSL